MVVLSTAFLPPLEYFALMACGYKGGKEKCVVEIEACESFLKQTYRNRFYFLGSQGREMLYVPVKHGVAGKGSTLITEVEIDYSTPWVVKMQRALQSAYSMAPFYDDYAPGLFDILSSGETKLYRLDFCILEYLLAALKLPVELRETKEFVRELPSGKEDYRWSLAPKVANTILGDLGLEKEYFQVFSPKFGFTRGLSVVDLLFNEGPCSWEYLMKI